MVPVDESIEGPAPEMKGAWYQQAKCGAGKRPYSDAQLSDEAC